MEGLRPEVDELDRFKSRSDTKTKVVAQPTSSGKKVPQAVTKSSSTMPFTILVLLLISVATAFSWFYWKQQIEISKLQAQLGDAAGVMDQSKLLIARLEGKLSETGVELAESGSAAEKKLAFLDSEMRKLWGVSYDRNKKAIEENQAALQAIEQKLATSQKDQQASAKKIEKSLDGVSGELKTLLKQFSGLETRLSSLGSELSVLKTEQVNVVTELKERLNEQDKLVGSVKKDTQNYLERTAKIDLSIESINASRRQLNERIVELDKKLNALQLQISPSAN